MFSAIRNAGRSSRFLASESLVGRTTAPRICSPVFLGAKQASIRLYTDGSAAKAAHPTKDQAKSGGQGETVSEFAKEDEGKISGIPAKPAGAAKGKPLASSPAPNLFSLADRTVIVAGAARGLGLTIATSILESGGHVAALDVLPEPVEPGWSEAQSIAEKHGVTLSYGRVDVTDQPQVQSVFADLFSSAPSSAPVRGLFISAGIQNQQPAIGFPADQFRRMIDINLTGTFFCAQAFGKEWITRYPTAGNSVSRLEDSMAVEGGASIVMVASMSGSVANMGLEIAPYCASKAGVVQLGRSLAHEWGKKGVRVNTLSPGYIRTAMTAAQIAERPDFNDLWLAGSLLGRISTPDEFRGPAIYLLSDASSFMTGSDLRVDGGHTAT